MGIELSAPHMAALLVVFFAIVAVIQDQNLFAGIIHYGLALEGV